jgi:hypothetical protein
MRKYIFLSICCAIGAFGQTVTPPFTYGGHIYAIDSSPVGVFLTSGSIPGGVNHWLYEPSVITPSPATNNQWVMLFNTNLQATWPTPEGIYMVASWDGVTPNASPQLILTNTPSNICDMADARPIWDGSLWHVYIQATSGCNNPQPPAFVAEARGPSLTQLAWVLDPGTNNAKKIIDCSCSTGAGIGESQQWFNTGPYGGYAPTPILLTYNNWNAPMGGQMYAYLTDFSQYNYWYNVSPAYTASTGVIYPDVILASPVGSASGANFAIGANSVCTPIESGGNGQYHMTAMTFHPGIVPYPGGSPQDGITVLYQLRSLTTDSNGQRGFSPRFARNAYGYLDLTSTGPNRWTTYVYYNDAAVPDCNVNRTDSANRFAVSRITVTQY